MEHFHLKDGNQEKLETIKERTFHMGLTIKFLKQKNHISNQQYVETQFTRLIKLSAAVVHTLTNKCISSKNTLHLWHLLHRSTIDRALGPRHLPIGTTRIIKVNAWWEDRGHRSALPEPLHEIECCAEFTHRQHAVTILI